MSAERATVFDLRELVRTRRVIICCGSGGVGKTTIAAALGVLAAEEGRRALVMTIDPALRLAQAMGVGALGHDPVPVPLAAPGRLEAMMLDTRRTFDALIERHAATPQQRDAILANPFYQQLAGQLGGSRELVAMERVLEACGDSAGAPDGAPGNGSGGAEGGGRDVLIVDTPPSQHALDFLDAPQRLLQMLDSSLTQLLVRPLGAAARWQFDLFRQSSAGVLKVMERLTGVSMLADLSEFLLAFSGVFEGLRARSHAVSALLADPGTAFALVAAPQPASIAEVERFRARLAAARMAIGGVIVNRVHPAVDIDPAAPVLDPVVLAARLQAGRTAAAPGDPPAEDLARRVLATWADAAARAHADAAALAPLAASGLAVRTVATMHRDVAGLHDLRAIAQALGRLDPHTAPLSAVEAPAPGH